MERTQVDLTSKALIPAIGRFASLGGLTIGEVFKPTHPLLDQDLVDTMAETRQAVMNLMPLLFVTQNC
jgi:hypothetical protein